MLHGNHLKWDGSTYKVKIWSHSSAATPAESRHLFPGTVFISDKSPSSPRLKGISLCNHFAQLSCLKWIVLPDHSTRMPQHQFSLTACHAWRGGSTKHSSPPFTPLVIKSSQTLAPSCVGENVQLVHFPELKYPFSTPEIFQRIDSVTTDTVHTLSWIVVYFSALTSCVMVLNWHSVTFCVVWVSSLYPVFGSFSPHASCLVRYYFRLPFPSAVILCPALIGFTCVLLILPSMCV